MQATLRSVIRWWIKIPDLGCGEQLVVVLMKLLLKPVLFEFLLCGMRKWFVSVNHFGCQCIFSPKTMHAYVLTSPHIFSFVSEGRGEHLADRELEEPDGTCGIQPPHLLLNTWIEFGHRVYSALPKNIWL